MHLTLCRIVDPTCSSDPIWVHVPREEDLCDTETLGKLSLIKEYTHATGPPPKKSIEILWAFENMFFFQYVSLL